MVAKRAIAQVPIQTGKMEGGYFFKFRNYLLNASFPLFMRSVFFDTVYPCLTVDPRPTPTPPPPGAPKLTSSAHSMIACCHLTEGVGSASQYLGQLGRYQGP